MRTKNELYQEALRTVAARRQMARARAEDARAEAEAAVPALRHAEDEVRVRGLRCALAGASGKDRTEAAAALADARQKLTALLAASGRPADALEPKFSCKLCQDTGTVNGRTCSCVHKVMQQLRRQEIEQLSSLSISSFDTMELRYYPNTMDAQSGVNVRAYMDRLLDGLKQYAEDFSPTENESLMLIGNAGLGKTHAALAIAGLVLEQGHDVIYVSSPDFFGKIEASRFDPSGDADTLLRTASTADLLILDDLGTEFVTPYFITVFYSLLNNRLGAGLPTIITTNITDGALLEIRYTEKISSRLSAFNPPSESGGINRKKGSPAGRSCLRRGIFDVIPFCSQNSSAGLTSLRRCACTMQSLSGTTPAAPSVLNTVCRASAGVLFSCERWHRAKRLHPS